jgi:hypothetical protein
MRGDHIIEGLTGHYRWIRRRVWFWEVARYEEARWRKSDEFSLLRPVMILQVRKKPRRST